MGYGGYVSAKLPPAPPTEQEAAVQAVKSLEAMEMMHKLVYNCAVQPKEDKYRRVRLTNPKVKSVLVDAPGAVEALTALGWAREEADGEAVLVVPSGKFMSMAHVRIIEAARDKLQKDLKDHARHNNSSLVA